MPKLFYVGIKGIILQDGKALLLKSNRSEQAAAYWDFPGGRMEVGESITDALTRELHEEIPTIENITVQNLVGAFQLSRTLQDGSGLMLLLYRVHAHVPAVQLSNEHETFRWCSKHDIDAISQDAHLNDMYRNVLLHLCE